MVVSALARPLESMVNLTDVRTRGADASGIEVRLGGRLCWFLNGDDLPPAPETCDVELGGLDRGTGLIAGASAGSAEVLPMAFRPRVSLTLRDRPWRPEPFTGELAEARLIFLPARLSFALAERRSSPFITCLAGELRGSGCGNDGIRAGCDSGSYIAVSVPEDGGLVKRSPGSTPLPWFIITNESSTGVGNEAWNMAISGVAVSRLAIGGFGASARSLLAGGGARLS